MNETKIEYWDKKQKLIKVTTPYKNGVKHGIACSYHKNGTMYIQINYKNGEVHGKNKYFYPNGIIEDEINFVNDRIHGIAKNFWENGNLAITETWKDNFLHGEKIFYGRTTGVAIIKEIYKDGIKIKTEELYKI